MEQRNEFLKSTGEQTQKQLKELIQEKTNLEREINQNSLALTEAEKKINSLNRMNVVLKEELTSIKVMMYNFDILFLLLIGRS